jgi:23S rRNA (guanosine2251-2'-O)-methyltransferase
MHMVEKKPQRERASARDRSPSPTVEDLIEGRNPVLEALKANRPINKLILSKGIGRHSVIGQILYQAKQNGVLVEYADARFIQKLSPTGHNQGVIAMIAAKSYVDLDDLLESSQHKDSLPLYIILDGIEDPHNLGAILRTADAAGVHGVIIPDRRAVGLTAAVSRASAGAVEYVPVARVSNIAKTITALHKQGIWTVGVDMEGTSDYTHADYDQAIALVIGAEGKGLSRLVKERCDLLISIPMKGEIASLNASIAAALVMYEAARQRDASAHPSS